MRIAFAWIFLRLLLVAAQYSPLIETHELNVLLSSAVPVHLLEIVNLGETRDPAFDSRIPQAKYLLLKSIVDAIALPVVKAPRAETIKEEMKKLGVKNEDVTLVLYDSKGVHAAAIAWWTMQVFGRPNVKVLNGGLPKWLREAYPTETGPCAPLLDPALEDDALYQYAYNASKMWTSEDLHKFESEANSSAQVQILDVRARTDFDLNRIQGSVNMPIEIINRADGTIRSAIELRSIFQSYLVNISNETLTVVLSRNGADSAAVLLALTAISKEKCVSVDGGWDEFTRWGGQQPAQEPDINPQPADPAPTPETPVPEPTTPVLDPPVVSIKSTGLQPSTAPVLRSTCDSACSASCVQNPNVDKTQCWDACGCESSPDLASFPHQSLSVPHTPAEAAQLQAFLACERTCHGICVEAPSAQQCREKCAFSFCFLGSAPASVSASQYLFAGVLLAALGLVCALGYSFGAKSVKRSLHKPLLSHGT